MSNRDDERATGTNYIASWSTFNGMIEYWRFYQSGQFLHVHVVGEAVRPGWRTKLDEAARQHLGHLKVDFETIPGYFSLLNFLYTVFEIFEFATRLCQKGVYSDQLDISIDIRRIKGFVLMADANQLWTGYRASSQDELGKTWTFDSALLISDGREHALKAATWFFERFGWLNPSIEYFAGIRIGSWKD